MRGQIDNSQYYLHLGKKIRKIREEQALYQKEVALKMGISFQQYQKYENGRNRLPTKSLVTFCELTNTDIKELTGCKVNGLPKIANYNTNISICNSFIIKNNF